SVDLHRIDDGVVAAVYRVRKVVLSVDYLLQEYTANAFDTYEAWKRTRAGWQVVPSSGAPSMGYASDAHGVIRFAVGGLPGRKSVDCKRNVQGEMHCPFFAERLRGDRWLALPLASVFEPDLMGPVQLQGRAGPRGEIFFSSRGDDGQALIWNGRS